MPSRFSTKRSDVSSKRHSRPTPHGPTRFSSRHGGDGTRRSGWSSCSRGCWINNRDAGLIGHLFKLVCSSASKPSRRDRRRRQYASVPLGRSFAPACANDHGEIMKLSLALDRYAARCAHFVLVLSRIAVLGARSAPKPGPPRRTPAPWGGKDTGNQPRGAAGISRAPWLVLMCAAAAVSCSSNGTQVEVPSGGPTAPSGLDAPATGNVRITRVRAFIKDGRPQAFLQGEIGDGCNSLQRINQQRTDSRFDITVTYRRQGEICTMIMQFLNEWVPLNGTFAPGNYVLRVNDSTFQFRLVSGPTGLHIDPDPGPLPQPPYLPSTAAPPSPR
jgi:hypothetical protein